MKTQQRTWQYLTLIAVVAVGFSCNTSKQTAQTGEADDLYGNSGNAVVYADNSSNATTQRPAMARNETQSNGNTGALRRNNRNANPDYADDQRPYSANQDEYYSELSTRNLNRGISADPGWGNGNNDNGSYNDGFTNGYYAGLNNPAYNSSRWNPWGYNNSMSNGFNIGLGLGAGMYGYNSFSSPFGYSRFGFGNSFGYSPFGYGGGYGYSPFSYGGGGYDPFYSSYGYGGHGGFGGYSPFGYGYSPFGYGGGYGGFGSPVYVNNSAIVSGADPYRNARTYGARGGSANGRYNDGFVNSSPANNNGGRSSATGSYNPSSSYDNRNSTGNSDGYYASPRQNSRNGNSNGYYYGNDGNGTGGRSAATGNSTYTPPASNNSGSGDYYARPRQNGSSYTPNDGNSRGNSGYSNGSGRSGYQQQSQPSYQQSQPSYQQRSSQQSQPSYQQSQPSYSAPSYNSGGSRGSSGGGYSGGGGGGGSAPSGGGGRGPR